MRMIRSVVAAALGGALFIPLPAHASTIRDYVTFNEVDGGYRGVSGAWTDADWTGIPCPTVMPENAILTYVNAFGNGTNWDTHWVQVGSWKRRYYSGSNCVADYQYYWERNTGSLHNKGWISGISPIATREFGLNRVYAGGGCATGATWCWAFRIDGTTRHTCCSDIAAHEYASKVQWATECQYDSGSDCDVNGVVNPVNDLAKKNLSDNWGSWSGRDAECVDYAQGGRGKWLADDSVKGGWNVNMSDSISGDPC